jgi:hypothetical protein
MTDEARVDGRAGCGGRRVCSTMTPTARPLRQCSAPPGKLFAKGPLADYVAGGGLPRAGGIQPRRGNARRPRCSSISEEENHRPFGKIKFFYPNGRWWHLQGTCDTATWHGNWPSPLRTGGCKGSSVPLTMAEIPEAGLIQRNPDFNGAQQEGNACRTDNQPTLVTHDRCSAGRARPALPRQGPGADSQLPGRMA